MKIRMLKAGEKMKKFAVDFSHSSITFSVKHMMIANVIGHFNSYHAEIEADSIEDLINANISIEIDVASISTNDLLRDQHLTSNEFFYADKYPKITYNVTSIEQIDHNKFYIHGDMTIKEVTKPVIFETTYKGHVKSPWGQDTYGFSAAAKINRKDFNLTYNARLESGGLLIGELVDVNAEFEIYPIL